MARQFTFRFNDEALNRKLVGLLMKHRIAYSVDGSGTIRYSAESEEVVENQLISKVRDGVFPSWQIVTCPKDWVQRYKDYMIQHGVPFREEMTDNELWFLIPRRYRPHKWVFEDSHSAAS